MYKGYQTYRHFINAKLHGLAVLIVGQKRSKAYLKSHVLNVLVDKLPSIEYLELASNVWDEEHSGIFYLSDTEAQTLYKELLDDCRKVKANLKTSKQLTGTDDSMTPGQRKAIIKLTKYDFHWSPEASFSFILGLFPDKRKRLNPWEIQNSKLIKLFSLLNNKDADKVIKRLDKIKQRNAKNG